MRILTLSVLAVATLAAAPSFAQDSNGGNTYVTLGYSQFQFARNAAAGTPEVELGSITGRIGYQFNPNFAIEGEGGFGVNDDKVLGVTVKGRGTLGAYVVGIVPVGEKFSLLGRAGYQQAWVEAKLGSIKVKDDDGSFAIGVGAQYMFDDANGVRADYTRYTENDGTDGFAISYVRKF